MSPHDNATNEDDEGRRAAAPHKKTDAPDYVRRAVRDLVFQAPARIFPAASGFLLILVASRHLAPPELGRYSLIVGTVALVSVIVAGWIDQSAMRFAATYRDGAESAAFKREHFTLSFTIAAISATIGALIVWGLSHTTTIDSPYFALTLALIAAQVVYNSGQIFLQATSRTAAYAAVEVIRALLLVVLSIWLLFYQEKSAASLLTAYAAALITGLLLGLILIRPFSTQQRIPAYLQKASAYGVPLIGWFLGNQLFVMGDRYLIGWFLGPGEVGIYHANASVLPGALLLLMAPLLFAAQPAIMRASTQMSEEQVGHLIAKFTKLFVLIVSPLLACIILLSKPLAQVLLGQAYAEAYYVAPIIAVGLAAWNAAMYGQKRLELANQTRRMLALVSISAAANIILGYLLIPHFGLLGAAVSTSSSYALYAVLVYMTPGPPIRWRLPTNLLPCTAAAFFVSWIGIHLLQKIVESTLFLGIAGAGWVVASFTCAYLVFGHATLQGSVPAESLTHESPERLP